MVWTVTGGDLLYFRFKKQLAITRTGRSYNVSNCSPRGRGTDATSWISPCSSLGVPQTLFRPADEPHFDPFDVISDKGLADQCPNQSLALKVQQLHGGCDLRPKGLSNLNESLPPGASVCVCVCVCTVTVLLFCLSSLAQPRH